MPEVLYAADQDDRYTLFTSRLLGQTLNNGWPSLSEKQRWCYVNPVVEIYITMAEWKGEAVGDNLAQLHSHHGRMTETSPLRSFKKHARKLEQTT